MAGRKWTPEQKAAASARLKAQVAENGPTNLLTAKEIVEQAVEQAAPPEAPPRPPTTAEYDEAKRILENAIGRQSLAQEIGFKLPEGATEEQLAQFLVRRQQAGDDGDYCPADRLHLKIKWHFGLGTTYGANQVQSIRAMVPQDVFGRRWHIESKSRPGEAADMNDSDDWITKGYEVVLACPKEDQILFEAFQKQNINQSDISRVDTKGLITETINVSKEAA